jgi:CheY-like chemotaxis protein
MTGFDLAQKARARQPDLKIVYMSGFPDKALEKIRPINGSVPYLAKPFRAADLVARVRSVIDEITVAPANDRAVTVVVVDDDDDVRETAVEALRRAGYNVVAAGGGAEALAALDANPSARLLFTDVKMPGIDGFMLADMAKMRWPKLKVLYATGYHDEVQTKPGIRHGEVLAKPYRAVQLTEEVRRALG